MRDKNAPLSRLAANRPNVVFGELSRGEIHLCYALLQGLPVWCVILLHTLNDICTLRIRFGAIPIYQNELLGPRDCGAAPIGTKTGSVLA